MAYNAINDILGEISEETLLQLVVDGEMDVTANEVRAELEKAESDLATEAGKAADNIRKCLERASAEVDGYCSAVVPVPFDLVAPFVKGLDLDIAIYNLFSRRDNIPEHRTKRYDNAVKALVMISKGLLSLGTPKTEPAPATTKNVLAGRGTSDLAGQMGNF